VAVFRIHACYFDADPDLDPLFQIKSQILEKVLK
jgi:hypothetical protein